LAKISHGKILHELWIFHDLGFYRASKTLLKWFNDAVSSGNLDGVFQDLHLYTVFLLESKRRNFYKSRYP
jgi:hypothetical protein